MILLLLIGLTIFIIYRIKKRLYEKQIILNKLNILFIRSERIRDTLVNTISTSHYKHLKDIRNIYLIVIYQKQMVKQLK